MNMNHYIDVEFCTISPTIPGRNFTFFGCPISQNRRLSLLKILVVRDDDSEYTVNLKRKLEKNDFGCY